MNLRAILPLLTVAATAPLLGGCPPPSYGLLRESELARLPDLNCINGEIGRIAGMVQRQENGGEDDIFGTPTEKRYDFFYHEDQAHSGFAYMTFVVQHNGRVDYLDWFGTGDEKTVQAAAVAYRPTMIALEDALARHCGMEAKPGTSTEECEGFSCGALGAAAH